MMKKVLAVLLAVMFAGSVSLAQRPLTDERAICKIEPFFIPAYGEEGAIFACIGLYGYGADWPQEELDAEVNGLCVKAFIQVPGSETWWVKPTLDCPYVVCEQDSTWFFLNFITGGDDIHATDIVLMVMEMEDAMLTDYDLAADKAISTLHVKRSPEMESNYEVDSGHFGTLFASSAEKRRLRNVPNGERRRTKLCRRRTAGRFLLSEVPPLRQQGEWEGAGLLAGAGPVRPRGNAGGGLPRYPSL